MNTDVLLVTISDVKILLYWKYIMDSFLLYLKFILASFLYYG